MPGQHYNYSPSDGGRHNRNGGGLIELLLDMAVSVIVAIPTAIAFLVRGVVSLFSSREAAGQAGRVDYTAQPGQSAQTGGQSGSTYHYAYAPGEKREQVGTQSQYTNLHKVQRPGAAGQAKETAKETAKKSPSRVKLTSGRGLAILGGVATGFFGLGLVAVLAEGSGLATAIASAFLTGCGLLTLWSGLRKQKKARLYLKYLGLIGRRESVSLTTLAQAAGRSRKKVCRELQEMLDQGVLPTGYLDLAGDRLVLSEKGIDDKPQEEAEASQTPADENDILRQIREVNDSIPDPVMSAKIDRIGEITGKILDYQRKNPGKAKELRSFLNYYLPTTLKILRAYAQLDLQGVEGENISAAKTRIEGMMDKVVEGFEKQLDRLFQDDALDITSDVAVLEKMLDKDGLNQDSPFQLGT